MALFNNGSREERDEQKMQQMMERYGLSELTQDNYESCRKIFNNLLGSGLMKAGMALSFSKTEELCKVSYLSAMVEQNWIVIRQLDEMNQRLNWMMKKMNQD